MRKNTESFRAGIVPPRSLARRPAIRWVVISSSGSDGEPDRIAHGPTSSTVGRNSAELVARIVTPQYPTTSTLIWTVAVTIRGA